MKQTVKRVYPGFNETYYGYRSFSDLLEDAAKEGLITLDRDEPLRQLPRPLRPLKSGSGTVSGTVPDPIRFSTWITAGGRAPAQTCGWPRTGSLAKGRRKRMPMGEKVVVRDGIKVVRDGINVTQGTPTEPIARATLFLRVWRVTEPGKPQRTLASLYMVRPGRGEYVVKELIPDMELGPQAALDKAVAIAKRGDVADIYVNADLSNLPQMKPLAKQA